MDAASMGRHTAKASQDGGRGVNELPLNIRRVFAHAAGKVDWMVIFQNLFPSEEDLKHIWKQVDAVVDPTLIEMPFTAAQHMQRRANTMRSHISASARDVLEMVYGLQGSAEE